MVQAVPVHPGNGREALGREGMKAAENGERFLSHFHGDVDSSFNSAFIHDAQNIGGILRVEVVVEVNRGELRSGHGMRLGHEHGARLEVTEAKIDVDLGGDHRYEFVCFRHGSASHGMICRLSCRRQRSILTFGFD